MIFRRSQGLAALFLASLLVGLAGCGRTDPPAPRLATHLPREEGLAVMKQFDAQFLYDEELSDAEVGALGFDLRKISGLEIAGIENDRSAPVLVDAYAKIFGDPSAHPFDFLFERIKLIASSKQKLANNERPDPETVAQNLSVASWLGSMIDRREKGEDPGSIPDQQEGTRSIHMNSSRIGFIQLGDPYSKVDDSIFRISTLIHEARHSDCPDGISAAQLDKLIAEGRDISSDRVLSIIGTCGFLHFDCPSGHPLAGKPACEDGKGWGAYSVMIPFNRMLYRQCTNCSEADRQAAAVTASEAATRIVRVDDLLDGRLGSPNMVQRGYQN